MRVVTSCARRLWRLSERVLTALRALDVETPNRSSFPIIEVPLRDHRRIDAVGRFLFDRGVYVTLAAYPLVPKDEVGFRIQLTAANTDGEVDTLIAALEDACGGRRAAAARRGAQGGGMTTGRRQPLQHRLAGVDCLPGRRSVITALYLFVKPFAGSGPVINVLGLAPVLAIAAGVRMHRPQARFAWMCVALGFFLFWLGDLYTYSYPLLLDREVPFPSIGDGAYLAVYPALIAGVLILQRRRIRRGDRGSAIDAAIMTVGLALPSWVWLIAPYIHDHSLSTPGRLVSVAYPLADVLLLAVTVRLALDGGQRRLAFHLMVASIVCLLATDFVYGLMLMQGTYDHQVWLDSGWIGFYLLWGAAALHPSMSEIDQPAEQSSGLLTRFRLGLLAGASLIAPTIGIVDDLRGGDYDFAVVRAASLVLFGLVVSRMAGLMRQQERSLERERMLSSAGGDLVAATSREEIDEVALAAARAMAGPDLVTRICPGPKRPASARRLRYSTPPRPARPANREAASRGAHRARAARRPRARAGARSGCPECGAGAARRGRAYEPPEASVRRCERSPHRSRLRSSGPCSPRRCTAAAVRRASARSCVTRAT